MKLDQNAMDALNSIGAARAVHQSLIDGKALSKIEKRKLSRKVAGHLFAAEAISSPTKEARQIFVWLKTDAHGRGELGHERPGKETYEQYDAVERSVGQVTAPGE